jgi:hypothetical protein
VDTQICVKCKSAKSLIDFEWQKKRPAPRKTCKQCRQESRDKVSENKRSREYKRKWYEERKDIIRQQWERHKYGVCKEEIGITECQICSSTHKLCIDHCHATGKVRGILCSSCNRGIGFLKDNPKFLMAAVKYLSNAVNEKVQ